MNNCYMCPRECGANRTVERGFCGEFADITISKASLHMWEEPPISGKNGSGTIFFCGCNLKCVYCQNKVISRGGGQRRQLSPSELADVMLKLQDEGAHNINLVTPTHFAHGIVQALELAKPRLGIPIIYNSSGYEKVSSLKLFDGLVDVYLPDFKYFSSELAANYSRAADYPQVATDALIEMFTQTGDVLFDSDGLIKKGVIIRHLVLPSCRKDSINVLDHVASVLPVQSVRLSLMSQYTPDFALDCDFKNLHRKLTTFEYNSVLSHAQSLGFKGFFQALSSATEKYTPDFK